MARILESPQCAYRVHPVDELGLVIDAQEYYRAFYRTALKAERYIMLSGWQFDSDVALLRGEEAEHAEAPITLLKFLDWLCERKPELRIWILAWDFSVVFAAEREWMQKIYFHWATNERLRFRFDDNHVERGCHHQKFVVIDGALSFLGGLDLCDARWDDRSHRQTNNLRINVGGDPGKPFHDIQVFIRGREFTASLAELFQKRWERAGGDPFDIPPASSDASAARERIEGLVPIRAKLAALSRTDPHGSPDGPELCKEIYALHVAAIASATRLIYAETQYLSSHGIEEALERRMRASQEPKLEIALVLNMRGETLKEQAAVGLAQAQIIDKLRKAASETGHHLGIYYTLPECEGSEKPERATYIHSKLMIVDDRLLTVGSANLTNRSMSVDTELNLSVESEREGDELALSIRAIRGNLLGEHTGGRDIELVDGLVAHLERLAERGERGEESDACRLRRHPSPTANERVALSLVDPQKLPFDPDEVEDLDDDGRSNFLSGLGQSVRNLFSNRKDRG
jgi:phosphatidylserine/phosphatidylglycerophosphate/cardiolipin synthase-like enzyme